MSKKMFFKNLPLFCALSVTAIGITTTAIIFNSSILRIFPLYISLFIMFLMSKVNRTAYLIGGINSIFYAIVYFYFSLYASALYALLFSFPIQIITFIRWKKNSFENSTKFKSFSNISRVIISLSFTVIFTITCFFSCKFSSATAILDIMVSLLGILGTALSLFAYIEYTVISALSGTCTILLYISMILSGYREQVPYLVFSVYSLACMILAIKNASAIFKKQNANN